MKTRKELAAEYNVSIDTFIRWLKADIESKKLDLGEITTRRYYTTIQVALIYAHYGPPVPRS
jgi:hypothetical protein